MILKKLVLQNFRSYKQASFEFSPKLTVIIGPNTTGKTNILEAIYLLATGRSFRAGVEREMISHGQELARVSSKLQAQSSKREELELEIVLTTGSVQGKSTPYKRYLVNGIGRRKSDFVGQFFAVLFNPQDIELVTDSPGRRRVFLDNVLVQTSSEYARALTEYEKALRRRNKILSQIQDSKNTSALYSIKVFEGNSEESDLLKYWDKLLVENGRIIQSKREKFILFLNNMTFTTKNKRSLVFRSNNDKGETRFDRFAIEYNKSKISYERLREYSGREAAAGYTLIGPQKDDFVVQIRNSKFEIRNLSAYGSRGEQRLAVLWLKLGELEYLKEKTSLRQDYSGQGPILLLDDIFSELDHEHRDLVQKIIPEYQTIITTADKHYIDGIVVDDEETQVIRL